MDPVLVAAAAVGFAAATWWFVPCIWTALHSHDARYWLGLR